MGPGPSDGVGCSATRNWKFRQPAVEEAPLGPVVGDLPRPPIGRPRLLDPPHTAQELRFGGVELAEIVEAEPVDETQGRLGSLGLGDGDGTV